MTVTREAGHGDETQEAGAAVGARPVHRTSASSPNDGGVQRKSELCYRTFVESGVSTKRGKFSTRCCAHPHSCTASTGWSMVRASLGSSTSSWLGHRERKTRAAKEMETRWNDKDANVMSRGRSFA